MRWIILKTGLNRSGDSFLRAKSLKSVRSCFLDVVSFAIGVGTNFNLYVLDWRGFFMYFLLDSVFNAVISLRVFFRLSVCFALSNPVSLLISRPWLRDHTIVSFNNYCLTLKGRTTLYWFLQGVSLSWLWLLSNFLECYMRQIDLCLPLAGVFLLQDFGFSQLYMATIDATVVKLNERS